MKKQANKVEELLHAMRFIIPDKFENWLKENPIYTKNTPGKGNEVTITLSLSDLFPFRKWDLIEFPGNNKAIVYGIYRNTLSCYSCKFPKNKILSFLKWQWYKFYLTVLK